MNQNDRRAAIRYLLQIAIFVLIFALSLFLPAGRWDWGMGWAYVTVIALSQFGVAAILISKKSALLDERSQMGGKRDLDRVLAGVMAVFGPVSICIVAGLNLKNGWPPSLPFAFQLTGLALGILGSALTVWAMAVNQFFYGVMRVAKEKGHVVCDRGPYRIVRHPGYIRAALFTLASPLILHSVWAFFPALLTIVAILLRTRMEDANLQTKLDGYRSFTQRTRFRLFPGIW